MLAGDLDAATYEQLADSPILSWDLETSGLDWRSERIATVQIHDRGTVVLVQHLGDEPKLLKQLLESTATPKVLHHAMFDLRFMASAWGAAPANVRCTKIAAKLLGVPKPEQSLAPLVRRYLGVALDKAQQVSDWGVAELSKEQIDYAVGDVCYLDELLEGLRADLEREGRWGLAEGCFAHLPTRVALDVRGFDDLFVY